MLAIMSVIIDYMLKSVILTFYILQVRPPNIARPGVTYPLTLFQRAWVR